MRKQLMPIAAVLCLLVSACRHSPADSSSIQSAPSSTAVGGVSAGDEPTTSGHTGETAASSTSATAPSHSAPTSGRSSTTARPTVTSTTSGGFDIGQIISGANSLIGTAPLRGAYVDTNRPAFTWRGPQDAVSYTFILEKLTNGVYKEVAKRTGLTAETLASPVALDWYATYRWRVTAQNKEGGTIYMSKNSDKDGICFEAVDSYKNHPANKGLDFSFDGKVSEKVLKNYLSRSMIFSLFTETAAGTQDDLRMILHTGAKYIGRSLVAWVPGNYEAAKYPEHEKAIAEAHRIDPDIVFEATVFETTWTSVEDFVIPEYVCKAFGQPYTGRTFSYQKMLYPSGKYVNHWGEGGSVPDINQLETQMFFYYRATTYIDMGFEGIHFGQVHLIGEQDAGFRNWTALLNKIRAYAKTNARRHFVFLNAHTHGIVGSDGRLLFDFHAYPTRVESTPGSVAHPPEENKPQEAIIGAEIEDSLIGRSLGGLTHSDWYCDSLPYFIELDNYGPPDPAKINQPGGHYITWGYDECSWFANQPKHYRQSWMRYAYNEVRRLDPQGFFEMLGSRYVYLYDPSQTSLSRSTVYYANAKRFAGPSGFDDEDAIRQVWIDSRR